ncbi:MAG: protein translocase subunit SecD [Desulfobulbaceae bacterium]|uniref:Multifunctional fusion protein n=1 Tax=Candidatus Desulfobia pelagia TaxID=2841692 RepID=A0A8J6NF23_9BACT|nr:protein translocase subunit SecD [Candidatus Desulfobia pelagia]
MTRALKWKIALLAFFIAFSGITMLPSVYKNMPTWWQKYMSPEGLRLGLDLQGGMHLVLKVDLEKAIENSLEFAAQDLKNQLRDKKISVVQTPSRDPQKIVFTLPNTESVNTVETIIKDDFPNLEVVIQAEQGTFPRITLNLSEDQVEFINKNAVNQSLEIIRNRIDQFGVAEPVIVRQGKDEIIVQLPGVKDPKRALSLIGQTAQLEFKIVVSDSGINLPDLIGKAASDGQWSEGDSREKLNQALQRFLPDETEVYFEKEIQAETGREIKTPLLIKEQILMTGDMVKDAQVRVGGTFNEPYVSLDLTGRGAKVFGKITEDNTDKRLAIVLDNVVRSAPVIREKILGGSAQITGSFTYEEANDLAIILRVGALPAPVSIVQNLTVGASLGQDSINKGLAAGLLGTALVLLFMVFYYRLSGVIATAALLLNILFVFAGLAAMQATLTLPGIAGIILSIGMAVDSNVLIFERMREEFALGKSVRSGIESGYEKAFSTIVDSQVTTLITALALFLFGTGPIKGFAVTLSLGVTFNLFTTLFATRLAYDILYSTRRLKPISFLTILKKPNLDYMQMKKFTFALSGILVVCGLIAFTQILRGQGNLGVDFTGGSLLQYKADKSFDLNTVRNVFATNSSEGVELQPVTSENRLIVKIKKSEQIVGDDSVIITNLLTENMPEHNFVLESQSEIGSSISEMLRNKALQAIAISLFGVICYLALRFDIRFGVAAAIATFHDVIVVLGICWAMNIEITLLIVTALLTLAGYSLNDSVVVFDRIRENMRKQDLDLNFTGIINVSINEVLSRTIVTSLTSALVLAAIFFLGGTVIHDFSFALLAGLLVGTYSSIFVASPILHLWPAEKS